MTQIRTEHWKFSFGQFVFWYFWFLLVSFAYVLFFGTYLPLAFSFQLLDHPINLTIYWFFFYLVGVLAKFHQNIQKQSGRSWFWKTIQIKMKVRNTKKILINSHAKIGKLHPTFRPGYVTEQFDSFFLFLQISTEGRHVIAEPHTEELTTNFNINSHIR